MILPYLIHGMTIWGNTYVTHLKRLKSFQNKAVKVIAGGQYLDDSTAQYKQLNILKTEDLYTLKVTKLMHKFYQNKLPKIFSFFYSNKCDTHTNHPFGILQPKSLYPVVSNGKNAKILQISGS